MSWRDAVESPAPVRADLAALLLAARPKDRAVVRCRLRECRQRACTAPSFRSRAGTRNAEKTRHRGVEVGTGVRYGDITWRSAYTWSRFTYVDDPEFADNDLPGTPGHGVYTEVRYEHLSGMWVAPNLDASPSSYYVDSPNTTENVVSRSGASRPATRSAGWISSWMLPTSRMRSIPARSRSTTPSVGSSSRAMVDRSSSASGGGASSSSKKT